MRVVCYAIPSGAGFGAKRSREVAAAMAEGLGRHGVDIIGRNRFDGIEGDVAVAYGWIHELEHGLFSAYRDAGKQFVFLDLGYWHRSKGMHRVAVNSWDTADSMPTGFPMDRFEQSGITCKPFVQRDDGKVMIAAMSDKAAWTHAFEPMMWENQIAGAIKRLCPGVPIEIRRKDKETLREPIEQALKRVRLLVTHHGNTAVDALIEGVPFYAVKGAARLIGPHKTVQEFVRAPIHPSDIERKVFLRDLAYAQWTLDEMRTGKAWDTIKRLLRP